MVRRYLLSPWAYREAYHLYIRDMLQPFWKQKNPSSDGFFCLVLFNTAINDFFHQYAEFTHESFFFFVVAVHRFVVNLFYIIGGD